MEVSKVDAELRRCYSLVWENATKCNVPIKRDTLFGETIEQIEVYPSELPLVLGKELYLSFVFEPCTPVGNTYGATVVHGYVPNGVAKQDTGCNAYVTVAGEGFLKSLQELESTFPSYKISFHFRDGASGQRLLLTTKKGAV